MKRYGREIWRSSENKGFIPSINIEILYPDEYLLYTELINPFENRYLYRGNYELLAEITTTNGKIYSSSVEIEIK